jgi:DNA-binding IclR family transcriptional regulator
MGLNGKRLRSVERALRVLCALAQAGGPLGISEISRRTGLAKSTVHLNLQTMRDLRFVEQDFETDRYVLGLAAAQLGVAALEHSRIVAALAPAMEELANRSREAVSLGIRTGNEVMFVKRFETSHVLRTSIREGTRMPLHASASGKCLLLDESEEGILRLYPNEELPEQAGKTLRARTQLLAELEVVRARGYATSHDEYLDGVSGAAVPVWLGDRVAASLSIAGPTARFRADGWIDDLLSIVQFPGSQMLGRGGRSGGTADVAVGGEG